jgi:hypothetical protein
VIGFSAAPGEQLDHGDQQQQQRRRLQSATAGRMRRRPGALAEALDAKPAVTRVQRPPR